MIIYGAGEQGRVVLDSLRRRGVNDVAFVDDDETLWGETVAGVPVLGGMDELDDVDGACHVAFGDEQTVRLEIVDRVRTAGLSLETVIDPAATVSGRADIGNGAFINAETYVGPGADLGEATLVDSLVNLSHDVTLGPGATVGPGATLAGGVTVGRDAFVGGGATILDDIAVGTGAVVGAGAVVIEDVRPEQTVVGMPAHER